MTTVKQLLSERVVTGFPEQRLSDLANEIEAISAQYCAVVAGDNLEIIGLVRFSEIAARASTSNRILSDLMKSPPAQSVTEAEPTDVVEGLVHTFGVQEITVVASSGRFVGLITPESFVAWLLESERKHKQLLEHQFSEQARLMDFVEKKVSSRLSEVRETLNEFQKLCLSLSHDIRSPLRSIRGFAEILDADFGANLPLEAREVIARIQSSARKGELLAQNLLGRAQESFGDNVASALAIDLNEVFADTLLFLDSSIRERNARVSARSPLHSINGYYVAVLQVFINLIGNSLKYVPPGRSPIVEVWSERSEEGITLCIQDNGVGISDHHRENLFKPFHERSSQSSDGIGLGLSIMQNAVNQLGGRIGLKSDEGEGTLFSVVLRPSVKAVRSTS